ncbi:4'-phosphopantetheinyl transferase family protein [Patiriisocius sp. Uisw_017]|uniref:4'-phosphopantetheinyl transferase family protein n=1 Tax=Patiriisocius sp. Uisw_017 TaxID=3230968 RepID=UPI0039ED8B60
MQKISIVKMPESNTFFTKEMLLKNLPESTWERANRYLDKVDSLSYITGRLLLKKALFKNGISTSLLEEIRYSELGKPSFTTYNFSISHSNWYVALIFGTKFSVGIDIEKKKNIDLKLFNYLFTQTEWSSIIEAKNSLERFYWFWVRKEALLKAAGCALKDLKQLEVFEHHGMYKDKRYYFESFYFDVDFNGIIAMEEKVPIAVEFVDITNLLEESFHF